MVLFFYYCCCWSWRDLMNGQYSLVFNLFPFVLPLVMTFQDRSSRRKAHAYMNTRRAVMSEPCQSDTNVWIQTCLTGCIPNRSRHSSSINWLAYCKAYHPFSRLLKIRRFFFFYIITISGDNIDLLVDLLLFNPWLGDKRWIPSFLKDIYGWLVFYGLSTY